MMNGCKHSVCLTQHLCHFTTDYWYMGKIPPMGANVAFSLYGALKGQSFSDCDSKSFINSFYTNTGFQSYAAAMYYAGESGFSNYAYADADDDGSYSGLDATCSGGYGVGCDATYGFAIHTYSTDVCNPQYVTGVKDKLSNLNSALSKTTCVKIYDSSSGSSSTSGTALGLLANSNSCFYQNYYSPDGNCPDPYGKIATYRQKFANGIQRQQKERPYAVYTSEVTKGKSMVAGGSLLLLVAGMILLMEYYTARKYKAIVSKHEQDPDYADGLVKTMSNLSQDPDSTLMKELPKKPSDEGREVPPRSTSWWPFAKSSMAAEPEPVQPKKSSSWFASSSPRATPTPSQQQEPHEQQLSKEASPEEQVQQSKKSSTWFSFSTAASSKERAVPAQAPTPVPPPAQEEGPSYAILESMKQSANRELEYRMAIFNGNVERIQNGLSRAWSSGVELTSPKPPQVPFSVANPSTAPPAQTDAPYPGKSGFTQLSPSPLPSREDSPIADVVNVSHVAPVAALQPPSTGKTVKEVEAPIYDEVVMSRASMEDEVKGSSMSQDQLDEMVGSGETDDSSVARDRTLDSKIEHALSDHSGPEVMLSMTKPAVSQAQLDNASTEARPDGQIQQDTEAILMDLRSKTDDDGKRSVEE